MSGAPQVYIDISSCQANHPQMPQSAVPSAADEWDDDVHVHIVGVSILALEFWLLRNDNPCWIWSDKCQICPVESLCTCVWKQAGEDKCIDLEEGAEWHCHRVTCPVNGVWCSLSCMNLSSINAILSSSHFGEEYTCFLMPYKYSKFYIWQQQMWCSGSISQYNGSNADFLHFSWSIRWRSATGHARGSSVRHQVSSSSILKTRSYGVRRALQNNLVSYQFCRHHGWYWSRCDRSGAYTGASR